MAGLTRGVAEQGRAMEDQTVSQAEASAATRARVLAVDDMPDNLFVLQQLVAQYLPECDLLTAGGAEQGLALAASTPLDAVLVDVQMPGVDGMEMCRRLKSNAETRDLPIALITAYGSTPTLRARGLEAGADDFLSRPIDNVELIARIRVLLRTKRAEDRLRELNARLEEMVNARTESLRRANERVIRVLESISDGFMTLDHNLVVTYFNRAAERLMNRRAQDVLERPLVESFPEARGSIFEEKYRWALQTRMPVAFETRFDVPPYANWYDVRVYPFEDGISVYFQITTERKQAQQTLERANHELAEKNRELESIIHIASHDLRSPLVNIQGFSQELHRACAGLRPLLEDPATPDVLRAKIVAILEADINESLDYILKGVAKMDSLLAGMLRICRLGRAELEIQPLDMNAMLADIVQSIDFQIKNAGATVRVDDLPACRGDAAQINQVFWNLLDNALKYLHPQRPGHIHVGGERCGDHVVYWVSDNGVGVAPDHCRDIFEIFRRLDPAGPVPGLGLGLAIVSQVVSRHQGRVWLESEPGAGCTFRLSLPVAQTDPAIYQRCCSGPNQPADPDCVQ